MRYIILCLLLAACGHGPRKIDIPVVNCDLTGCEIPKPPEIPKSYPIELVPHIEAFNKDAKLQGVTQHDTEGIEFQNGVLEDNPDVLGVCYQAGKRRWIRISSKWWAEMTEVYQRQLIYHELGHCGLSREHNDVEFTVNGKSYLSIMSTYVTFGDDATVLKEWSVLVEELFHPEKHTQANLHDESVVDDCFITPEGYKACPIIYGKASQ